MSMTTEVPATDSGDVWTFGDALDGETVYADGTRAPRRSWRVALNGVDIGQLEVHVHKRRGRDGRTDVSYGLTAVVFGPSPGGN